MKGSMILAIFTTASVVAILLFVFGSARDYNNPGRLSRFLLVTGVVIASTLLGLAILWLLFLVWEKALTS